LVQLQADLKETAKTGTQVVGISYDSVEVLEEFAEKNKIEYLLLSDKDSKTIDAYGVRNKQAPAGSRLDGIPHPGTFLVDQKGVVRAKWFLEGYRKRHANKELIEAARKLDAADE
jgi:peroxiredoxin